ncbi:C-type Lectin CRL-like [Lissotriton helveticus]
MMTPLIVAFMLLGPVSCGTLANRTSEDAVADPSAPESCAKVTISDAYSCPMCGIKRWTKIGNTCYQIFSSKISFSNAEMYCRGVIRGGRLASIHSYSDNIQLARMTHANAPRVWVGGLYLHEAKSYVWTDGSEMDFKNWSTGEPNLLAKEFCMEMFGNGKWNDLPCHTKQAYICEYRLSY